jgi:large subunit ribosomal protein L34
MEIENITLYNANVMPKRTYQPSKRRKVRKYGFRVRMRDRKGKDIIKRRREKGRKKVSS